MVATLVVVSSGSCNHRLLFCYSFDNVLRVKKAGSAKASSSRKELGLPLQGRPMREHHIQRSQNLPRFVGAPLRRWAFPFLTLPHWLIKCSPLLLTPRSWRSCFSSSLSCSLHSNKLDRRHELQHNSCKLRYSGSQHPLVLWQPSRRSWRRQPAASSETC